MFNDSPVLASLRKALLFAPVEFVDVTALVEFLDEAGIDEIRWLGGSGPLVFESGEYVLRSGDGPMNRYPRSGSRKPQATCHV